MQTVRANLRLDFFYNPVHHLKLMENKLWIMDTEETTKMGILLSFLVKTPWMWEFIFNYDEIIYVLLYGVMCLGPWQMQIQVYDIKEYNSHFEWLHNRLIH